MSWWEHIKIEVSKVFNHPSVARLSTVVIVAFVTYLLLPVVKPITMAYLLDFGVAVEYSEYIFWVIMLALFLILLLTVAVVISTFKYLRGKFFYQYRYHWLFHKKHGERQDIEKVRVSCPGLVKVAVVGEAATGKTTLIENILEIKYTNRTTTGEGIYIANISNSSYRYIGFLDGPGQEPADQNALAIQSDILIVMVDHNSSDVDVILSSERLMAHKAYLKSLISRIKREKPPLKMVFLLVNKHDLWSNLTEEDKAAFEVFTSEYTTDLENGIPCVDIEKIDFRKDTTDRRIEFKDRLIEKMKLC